MSFMSVPNDGSLVGELESASSRNSIVLLGDFSGHMGNTSVSWKGVIGRSDP